MKSLAPFRTRKQGCYNFQTAITLGRVSTKTNRKPQSTLLFLSCLFLDGAFASLHELSMVIWSSDKIGSDNFLVAF
jgi:hypothetical protein